MCFTAGSKTNWPPGKTENKAAETPQKVSWWKKLFSSTEKAKA